MLNSKQISNHITNISEHKQIQQVSVDLKIIKIEKLVSNGAVLSDKTIVPKYQEIQQQHSVEYGVIGWMLEPGYYALTFEQGVQIPNNAGMQIVHRSSMLRSGVSITSGLYDPNFQTDNIGAFATVNNPIFVEHLARVACIFGFECEPVSEDLLYNGQFQGK